MSGAARQARTASSTAHRETSTAQFSPDGRQIVSASFDDRVLLWDVSSGRSRAVPTLPGEKYAAAIDATGERIAIGGATPLVIQASDGSARVQVRGHGGYVNALAFSPDSKHLLTGSDDGTGRMWNVRTGGLERTLGGHEGVVRGVAYSDDGQSVATAGSDGTVRVWRADGGDPVTLVGHEGAVNTARFNRRGDRLVSAGDDGTIRVWDAAGGDALVVLHRHEGIASGADFSGDGRDVVSAGDDGVRITPCECVGASRTRCASPGRVHSTRSAPLNASGSCPASDRAPHGRGHLYARAGAASKLETSIGSCQTTLASRRTRIRLWPGIESADETSTMSSARIPRTTRRPGPRRAVYSRRSRSRRDSRPAPRCRSPELYEAWCPLVGWFGWSPGMTPRPPPRLAACAWSWRVGARRVR